MIFCVLPSVYKMQANFAQKRTRIWRWPGDCRDLIVSWTFRYPGFCGTFVDIVMWGHIYGQLALWVRTRIRSSCSY